MTYDYDLFTIGAGSGGVRASRMAAGFGAKTAIAEEYRIGGTCVIRGCVPKKLLVYASHVSEELADAAGYGWRIPQPMFSWDDLIANKDTEIDRLNGVYIRNLESAGVEMMQGRAVVTGPHAVSFPADGRQVTARHILVATGATPFMPTDVPGIDHAITSNEAFHLESLPERIVVVGGGYIAVEFAGIFNGLGVETVLLYRGEEILRGFDDDLRVGLHEEMTNRGVDVRVGAQVTGVEKTADGLLVRSERDGRAEPIAAGEVLYATGRIPNTAGLGLEEAGVLLDSAGAVTVDAWSRSSVESIHAIGDVTNRANLTPVAIREGAAFAETVFNGNPVSVDYRNIPTAVFSQPQVGTVGLSEADARRELGAVDIYKSRFRPMKHTMTGREEKALMKLVVSREGKVRGVHLLGPDAGELIQALGIAVTMGATKADFDATMAVHPTAAEELVTMREKWAG